MEAFNIALNPLNFGKVERLCFGCKNTSLKIIFQNIENLIGLKRFLQIMALFRQSFWGNLQIYGIISKLWHYLQIGAKHGK